MDEMSVLNLGSSYQLLPNESSFHSLHQNKGIEPISIRGEGEGALGFPNKKFPFNALKPSKEL